MKNHIVVISLLAILFFSCKGNEPFTPYVYETNPHYSFGYVQFYGSYYKEFGNSNNVIAVSLFSDSLYITEEGSLEGFGQYLYFEDVFISPTDTMLQTVTYTLNDSGEPYTISPGVNDTIDSEVYTMGATISYYEQNPAKSKMKLITDGTISVSKVGTIYNILFNLKTDDGKDLKGNFTHFLPFIDESLQTDNSETPKRTQIISRKL